MKPIWSKQPLQKCTHETKGRGWRCHSPRPTWWSSRGTLCLLPWWPEQRLHAAESSCNERPPTHKNLAHGYVSLVYWLSQHGMRANSTWISWCLRHYRHYLFFLFLPTTFLIKLNSPCMVSYKACITYLHLQIFYSPVGKSIISWFCKMSIIYSTGQNGSKGIVLMSWLSA